MCESFFCIGDVWAWLNLTLSGADLVLAVAALVGGGYAGGRAAAVARLRVERRTEILEELIAFPAINQGIAQTVELMNRLNNRAVVLPYTDRRLILGHARSVHAMFDGDLESEDMPVEYHETRTHLTRYLVAQLRASRLGIFTVARYRLRSAWRWFGSS